jgi:hypothetical protein
LGESLDDRLNVSASIGMEQVWDVLENNVLGQNRADGLHAVEENARLAAAKTSLRLISDKIRHDREVLTWAAERDTTNSGQAMCAPIADVFELASPRKSIGKAMPVDVIEFDLPTRSPTGFLEADVPATDAAADRAESELIHICSRSSKAAPAGR